MKLATLFALFALLISQDDKAKQQQQGWAGSEPGENHKLLEPLVGKWDVTCTISGAAQMKAQGTSEFRWAMGKRFLVEETKTQMPEGPFEWMAFHGYDNAAKQFVFASIDNGGTDIERLTGKSEDDGKTIAYEGDLPDGRGGMNHVRWVIHIDGPDTMRIEMFVREGNEKEARVLTIAGKRSR
jgi:hypothetical protein